MHHWPSFQKYISVLEQDPWQAPVLLSIQRLQWILLFQHPTCLLHTQWLVSWFRWPAHWVHHTKHLILKLSVYGWSAWITSIAGEHRPAFYSFPSLLPLAPHESQICFAPISEHQIPACRVHAVLKCRSQASHRGLMCSVMPTNSELHYIAMLPQVRNLFINSWLSFESLQITSKSVKGFGSRNPGGFILSFQGRLSSFRGYSTGPYFKKHFERWSGPSHHSGSNLPEISTDSLETKVVFCWSFACFGFLLLRFLEPSQEAWSHLFGYSHYNDLWIAAILTSNSFHVWTVAPCVTLDRYSVIITCNHTKANILWLSCLLPQPLGPNLATQYRSSVKQRWMNWMGGRWRVADARRAWRWSWH